MARERAYRHDFRCRRCGSNWMPKDGHTRGRQVHKCGDCKRKRDCTASAVQSRFREQVKQQAVQMRIEGGSISAAARVVGASVPSVSGWVKRVAGMLVNLLALVFLRQTQTQCHSTLRISRYRTTMLLNALCDMLCVI